MPGARPPRITVDPLDLADRDSLQDLVHGIRFRPKPLAVDQDVAPAAPT